MSDELRSMVKEIKKKVSNRTSTISQMTIAKMDQGKQMTLFADFLEEYSVEIKKSGSEGKYVAQMISDFEDMKLCDIRFVVEKSYDRYSKVVSLMKKYEENFTETEINKYNEKLKVLNDVLAFMISNCIGTYIDSSDKGGLNDP